MQFFFLEGSDDHFQSIEFRDALVPYTFTGSHDLLEFSGQRFIFILQKVDILHMLVVDSFGFENVAACYSFCLAHTILDV
jgi:hypothetical protein